MGYFTVKHQIVGQIPSQDLIGAAPVAAPLLDKKGKPLPKTYEAPPPASYATDRLGFTCGKLVVQVVSVKGQLIYTVTDTKGKILCQTTVAQP